MITTKLNSGFEMPVLGLGTWKAEPGLVGTAINAAIEVGYRHFDCASIYRNEKEIGEVFEHNIGSKVKREDVFITSKLWNTDHRPEDVEKAVKKTLSDLKLDYLDLYLMHWGIAFAPEGEKEPVDENGVIKTINVPIADTWEAMENLISTGLVKSIGVSNFSVMMIHDLLTKSKITPAVNQIEMHPYLQHKNFLEYANRMGIKLTAYSPLTRMGITKSMDASQDNVIIEIAHKYNKTPAQILLRWGIERGTIVIPKSITPERIKENFDVWDFEINKKDMEEIGELDKNYRLVDPSGWWKLPYFD